MFGSRRKLNRFSLTSLRKDSYGGKGDLFLKAEHLGQIGKQCIRVNKIS